ncbi:hypothetical protein LCGC14_0336700 [marine sediment metagenome]|uniref:Uncharacterized protein n=1 Tax=marine sediment metagenome TaxID=412755 RepID=A0A0F9TF64_9ZZZZ
MICQHCQGETSNCDPSDHFCTICKADPDNPEWLAEKDEAADNRRRDKELRK